MFNATSEFNSSVVDVSKLLDMINLINEDSDDDVILLKVAQVTLVSKFQVFVEAILNEYKETFMSSEVLNSQIPVYMRINFLKLLLKEYSLLKKVENPQLYSQELLEELSVRVGDLHAVCKDDVNTTDYLKIDTKFPMGKTGTIELKNLFRQIDGNEDIFSNGDIDIGTMDGILYKRHAIVHNDVNPHLSLTEVRNNIEYVKDLVTFIDEYLERCKNTVLSLV